MVNAGGGAIGWTVKSAALLLARLQKLLTTAVSEVLSSAHVVLKL
jgi:hypothetical protein